MAFCYRDLKQEANEVRLIGFDDVSSNAGALRLRLEHGKLAKAPRYTALSYTWGHPSLLKSILIDGLPFEVRENLFDALKAIERMPLEGRPRWLWVDAICINQRKTRERSSQVAMMGQIFSQAESVISWLGCGTFTSDIVMEFASSLDTQHAQADNLALWSQIVQDLSPETTRLDLCEILMRGYWDRMWVVQEVVLARRIWVMCGFKSCEWDQLHYWATFIFAEVYGDIGITLNITTLHDARTSMRAWIRADLAALLLLFQDHMCSDMRDKVYALLALVRNTAHLGVAPLQPDYSKSIWQVLEDVISYVTELLEVENDPQHRLIAEHLIPFRLAKQMGIDSIHQIVTGEAYQNWRRLHPNAEELHEEPEANVEDSLARMRNIRYSWQEDDFETQLYTLIDQQNVS